MKIGQQATTLSGGEAQRIKLLRVIKRPTGRTLYILDEPTTGLHSHDIKLLEILQAFANTGNTVVVIEHNLDVIKTADHIIDMGPEGGKNGGKIIAEGTPERVATVKESYTGKFIKEIIGEKPMKKLPDNKFYVIDVSWLIYYSLFSKTVHLSLGIAILLFLGLHFFGDGFAFDTLWSWLFRFMHVVVAIMWIGLLWYFNFVQIPNMPKIQMNKNLL